MERSAKIDRLLVTVNLASVLHHRRLSMSEMIERFKISERTVYRHLHGIEDLGFEVDKGFDGKYFVVPSERCPFCNQKHKAA